MSAKITIVITKGDIIAEIEKCYEYQNPRERLACLKATFELLLGVVNKQLERMGENR